MGYSKHLSGTKNFTIMTLWTLWTKSFIFFLYCFLVRALASLVSQGRYQLLIILFVYLFGHIKYLYFTEFFICLIDLHYTRTVYTRGITPHAYVFLRHRQNSRSCKIALVKIIFTLHHHIEFALPIALVIIIIIMQSVWTSAVRWKTLLIFVFPDFVPNQTITLLNRPTMAFLCWLNSVAAIQIYALVYL